jgi:hypothetical protein
MRLTFLFAFLIASSSAFAPMADAGRSHSVSSSKGFVTKASPKASEKAAPGKKQPPKASPPRAAPPSKSSPMKGPPASKTTPTRGRPKASLFSVTPPVKKGAAVMEIQPAAKKFFGIFQPYCCCKHKEYSIIIERSFPYISFLFRPALAYRHEGGDADPLAFTGAAERAI